MHILRKLNNVLDKGLSSASVSLANVLLILMALAIFVEVVTRYVFGFVHGQVQEYTVLFFMWVIFIMMGKVARENKHIFIGLLPEYLDRTGKVKPKKFLDVYISLSFLAFAIMFLYFGVKDTLIYIKTGYCGTLNYVPEYWVWHLALPVGAFILIYYSIRQLIQNINSFTQQNKAKGINEN